MWRPCASSTIRRTRRVSRRWCTPIPSASAGWAGRRRKVRPRSSAAKRIRCGWCRSRCTTSMPRMAKYCPPWCRPVPTIRSAPTMFRLGWPSYLIHGTNKPYGVGMRSSHGCIRLYPEDIAVFFDMIPIGTKVTVVNQPYLFGWRDGTLYLQAYSVMEDDSRDWSKNRKALLAKLLNPKLRKKIAEHDQRHRLAAGRRPGAFAARRAGAGHGRPGRHRRGAVAVAVGGEHLAGGLQLGRPDRIAGGREDVQGNGRRARRSASGNADSSVRSLMPHHRTGWFMAGLALACAGGIRRPPMTASPIESGFDYHSFANVDQFRVAHLDLDLRVDLEHQGDLRHRHPGGETARPARDAAGPRHQGFDDHRGQPEGHGCAGRDLEVGDHLGQPAVSPGEARSDPGQRTGDRSAAVAQAGRVGPHRV